MKERIVFESVFSKEFRDLVDTKRALGYDYDSGEQSFRRLDRFFIEEGLQEKKLTKTMCDKWCRKRSYESQTNHGGRISSLRVFARHLVEMGIEAYVPPIGITRHGQKYDAHIYTDDELARFFSAVDKSKSVPRECPYRAQTMPIFFRILYTSGMRVSELRLLRIRDFNLESGCITVREGKNQKERIIPVHPTLLLTSIVLSIISIVKTVRNKHTIPLVRSIRNQRSIKKGMAEYLRSLDEKISFGEKTIDGFFALLGEPANQRFLDHLVDHCWQLIKKSVVRFVLIITCIVSLFFIVRQVLLMHFDGLSFWEVIFSPVFMLVKSIK